MDLERHAPLLSEKHCNDFASWSCNGSRFCSHHKQVSSATHAIYPVLTATVLEKYTSADLSPFMPREEESFDVDDEFEDFFADESDTNSKGDTIVPILSDNINEVNKEVFLGDRMGIIIGFKTNLHEKLQGCLASRGGQPPQSFRKKLMAALLCQVFSASAGDMDMPMHRHDLKAIDSWHDLRKYVRTSGLDAVKKAIQLEFDSVKILIEALKEIDVFVFEDGVLDLTIENKGLHRVACRLFNILNAAFNIMQSNTTLNAFVGNPDYDLPLPDSVLKFTTMDSIQKSMLTGGTFFAFHHEYKPFQRVLHDLINRDFPQRGFRVKGDKVFQRQSVKPCVLVRAEVCDTCGFSESKHNDARCEFVRARKWHHVCRICGQCRARHNPMDQHVFQPLSKETENGEYFECYKPFRDKTVKETVQFMCNQRHMEGSNSARHVITWGDDAKMEKLAQQLKTDAHNRYLQMDSGKLSTKTGVWIKHDPCIGPGITALPASARTIFSRVGEALSLCFLSSPETYPSLCRTKNELACTSLESEVLLDDLDYYSLIRMDADQVDYPTRIYEYPSTLPPLVPGHGSHNLPPFRPHGVVLRGAKAGRVPPGSQGENIDQIVVRVASPNDRGGATTGLLARAAARPGRAFATGAVDRPHRFLARAAERHPALPPCIVRARAVAMFSSTDEQDPRGLHQRHARPSTERLCYAPDAWIGRRQRFCRPGVHGFCHGRAADAGGGDGRLRPAPFGEQISIGAHGLPRRGAGHDRNAGPNQQTRAVPIHQRPGELRALSRPYRRQRHARVPGATVRLAMLPV